MARNNDVRFISSSIKLPPFSPAPHSHSLISSLQLTPRTNFAKLPFNFNINPHPITFISQFLKNQPFFRRADEEERVLISEVFVRNKNGDELERKDLEAEALNALKASRVNSALSMREVKEDVHRILSSGYFRCCAPVVVDTRHGIQLIFQVEANQEFRGLVCEGANVLPLKFIEDAFRDGYGKVVNFRHLDEVIRSVNGWYMERGLYGLVSGVDILSGGIIKLQVSEAEVNNILIRFLDKTGASTSGETRPETILGHFTTKKGQVYSMIQGKRDIDTVLKLAMGAIDSISIIPQQASEKNKVDLIVNVVERKSGGGISGTGGGGT